MWLSFTVPFLSSGTAHAPLSTNYAENNRNGFSLGMLACPWQLEEWVCERSKLFRILLLFPAPTPFTFPHSNFSSLIGVTSVFSRYFTKMSYRLVCWSIWAILVSSMEKNCEALASRLSQTESDEMESEENGVNLHSGVVFDWRIEKNKEGVGEGLEKTKGHRKRSPFQDKMVSSRWFFCWLPKFIQLWFKHICFQFFIPLLNLGYHFSSFEVWSIEEPLEIITHTHTSCIHHIKI